MPMNALESRTSSPSDDVCRSKVSARQALSKVLRSGFLIACLLGGALLRLDFMRAGGFVIDADEAVVGLMAKHILEGGDIPVFYYGQHYMGSLEALFVAVSFYFFGISSFTLQLVPLVFSLVLILVLYKLGRELSGEVAGLVAALVCAFPPSALVVWSFKARGGFIELLVIGALALLYTVRWLRNPLPGYRDVLLLSVFLGLGWWVNNQIIYFILPIGVFCLLRSIGAARRGEVSPSTVSALLVLSIVFFGLGSLPYLTYNVSRGWPSLGMFQLAQLDQMGPYLRGLFSTALPILFGAKRFWENDPSFDVVTALAYLLYGGVFVSVLWMRASQISKLVRGGIDCSEPVELLFLFLVVACSIFVASSFGWLSQAPRYLLPLYIGIFSLVGFWFKETYARFPKMACCGIAALLFLNIASSYSGGRALPGEPVVYGGERVSRSHKEIISALNELNISSVRTNYWIGYRLAFETLERVTFRVLQEPRQIRISKYQELQSGAREDEIPLLLVPAERDLFVNGLRYLGYTFKERTASGYILIYDLQRPVYASLSSQIPTSEIVGAFGTGPQAATGAVDGDPETRWGTGESQRPGQVFEVSFKRPVALSGITYALGGWRQDYPRGLTIEVETERGGRATIVSRADYAKVSALLLAGDITLRFEPVLASRVIFTQRGSDRILDWSISELVFWQSAASSEGGARGEGPR